MSLRAFHLVFIALSVILAAFFGAWSAGEYQSGHQVGYAITTVASFAGAAGLAVYGSKFQRKTRSLQ
jgi:hypothetical protein